MSIDAVIFDCDGTLVDSEPLGLAVIVEEARALGIEFATQDGLLMLKGQSMATCLQAVALLYGRALPEDFEATVRRSMAAAFRENLQPMPGALEMLTSLKLPYCVASNGPRHKIELTLEITGLLSLFRGRIFSAYEVGSFKPEPGLFLHAAKAWASHRIGVPSSKTASPAFAPVSRRACPCTSCALRNHFPQNWPNAFKAWIASKNSLTRRGIEQTWAMQLPAE